MKRRKNPVGSGVGAPVTGRPNLRSVNISAQTRVVAGSMYPPKIPGATGAPNFVASIPTSMFPAGAANAFTPWFEKAAPATDAVTNSRRFIVMLYLLFSRWSRQSLKGKENFTPQAHRLDS